jgi:hypothetical protein
MKEFETETFKLKIHDNFLKELLVKKNHTLKSKDVFESRNFSESYKPGAKFYVLVEGEENASISAEARSAVASAEYSIHTKALALCSKSAYMAIVGNLFLRIKKPKVTTRFFDDRTKAIAWLESLMTEL